MFLLLAIVFAGGFVFFGVGSGSSGLGDVLQGNGNEKGYLLGGLGVLLLASAGFAGWLITQPGSRSWKVLTAIVLTAGGIALIAAAVGNTSTESAITKLQKTVAQNPSDAATWRKLAQALVQQARTDEAVTALETYTALRPKDSTGWQDLASEYLIQARTYYEQSLQYQVEYAGIPGPGIGTPTDSFLAQEFNKNPLYAALSALLSQKIGELQAKLQGTLKQRAGAYERAVKSLPESDPGLAGLVFRWGGAAEDAQDTQMALGAYQRYLQLAPDGPFAPDARLRVKELKKLLKQQQASTTGAG